MEGARLDRKCAQFAGLMGARHRRLFAGGSARTAWRVHGRGQGVSEVAAFKGMGRTEQPWALSPGRTQKPRGKLCWQPGGKVVAGC